VINQTKYCTHFHVEDVGKRNPVDFFKTKALRISVLLFLDFKCEKIILFKKRYSLLILHISVTWYEHKRI